MREERLTEYIVHKEATRHEPKFVLKLREAPLLAINWCAFFDPSQALSEVCHNSPRLCIQPQVGRQAQSRLRDEVGLENLSCGAFDELVELFEVRWISNNDVFGEVAWCEGRDIASKIHIRVGVLGQILEGLRVVNCYWVSEENIPVMVI